MLHVRASELEDLAGEDLRRRAKDMAGSLTSCFPANSQLPRVTKEFHVCQCYHTLEEVLLLEERARTSAMHAEDARD